MNNKIVPQGYQQTEIGVIPQDWEVVRLGSLSKNGIMNGIFNNPRKVGQGLKLINVVNLYNESFINYSELKLLEVSEKEYQKFSAFKGDLFFTRSSLKKEGIAHCNLFNKNTKDTVFECHIMRIRPLKERVNSYFLLRYCQSFYARKVLISNSKTNTMTTIDQKGLFSLFVSLPSLKEQQKIADILTTWDNAIEKQTALIKKKQHLKKGLMQQLLTGKTRFSEFSDDWEIVKLGDISKISTGNSNREDSTYDNGKYTFFDRSQDIRTSDIFLFDGEAVIVAGEGQDFIPKYFIGKFDLHQRTYAIMNFLNSSSKFIFYYIHHNKNYFLSNAVGSTVKSLRLPMFVKMPIKLPLRIKEQQKIAQILTLADNEITKSQTELALLKTQKKGLMQQLLTGKTRVKI